MSQFIAAIEQNWPGFVIAPGVATSLKCCDDLASFYGINISTDEGRTLIEEAHFSWSPCESCGNRLGGDRHYAHALYGYEVYHIEICTDCLIFHANGEEPEQWN